MSVPTPVVEDNTPQSPDQPFRCKYGLHPRRMFQSGSEGLIKCTASSQKDPIDLEEETKRPTDHGQSISHHIKSTSRKEEKIEETWPKAINQNKEREEKDI